MAALSRRDRSLLLGSAIGVLCLIVLLAFLSPGEDSESPSSFSNSSRGAKAAYLLLHALRYNEERWTEPISGIAATADAHTTLILSREDAYRGSDAEGAVRAVLAKGGRVLAMGLEGGALLPYGAAAVDHGSLAHRCSLQGEGLAPLAAATSLQMSTGVRWASDDPKFQAAYTCEGRAMVVTYKVGPGTVVWWASDLPLQNRAIREGGSAQLLLLSLGAPGANRIVWDEAAPAEPPGLWSYAAGVPLYLLWAQLALVGLLLLASFGRRSGPLRPDPVVTRSSPLEFVEALGALYRRAGATGAAVELAYRSFLARLDRYVALRALERSGGAAAVARHLVSRIPDAQAAATLEADLLACEAAFHSSQLSPASALRLVRSLHDHEQALLPLLHANRRVNKNV